jgi:two-component system phosphate regulon sensor histidine kinase PhoR
MAAAADSSDRRGTLTTFVLLPALIVAVGIVAYFTFRTTLQLDRLRQEAVVEATLGLAREKAARLDRQIIDQDNVVMAVSDPADLPELSDRWLPTAPRETPSVRAILILDDSHRVLAFASRAAGAVQEEESFRRLLVTKILYDMELSTEPKDQLRHLHKQYGAQGYLLSYWQRTWQGRNYVVVAWHDIGRLVKDTLPALYSDKAQLLDTKSPPSRVNVIDEESRIIYGPPLRSGEFTVGVPFPTTLYNWRLQVSPASAEALAVSVQNRRLVEIAMVGLSCLVIVAGVFAILLAAERARRISALKSEFVANVSHELKTPLALVRMFAEMLQSGRVASDEKRKEYLDIIMRESERLSGLIENVLDFARVERGRDAYDLAEGDVGEAVTRAANVYRYRAERENIKIEVDVAEDLPRALIDERALQLAVINLIDNALKYAPDGELVTVSAAPHGDDRIAVKVKDRGPGVPADERTRIFERFVRGESAETGKGEKRAEKGRSPVRGSGIGLALVKHIAEAHGGRTWVESEVGKGATFIITIPAAERRSKAKSPAAAPAAVPESDAPSEGPSEDNAGANGDANVTGE